MIGKTWVEIYRCCVRGVGLLLVVSALGGCAALSSISGGASYRPATDARDDDEYTADVKRFVWATQDISKPALEEALKNFTPSKRVKANAAASEENSGPVLEYAMEYALEYASQCALDDIMKDPPEKVLEELPGYAMKDIFAEAFQFSLDHILEKNIASFSEDAVAQARGLALEFARKSALQDALNYALAKVADPALRDSLNKELDGALDAALENAFATMQAKDTATIPSIWPVDSPERYISSEFAAARKSLGGSGGRLHKGIDIVAPRGIPVFATADGRVESAERGRGYGLVVTIKHANGYSTLYAHLDAFSVKEGDEVVCGQEIGKLGATGNAACPHVHYEVHQNDNLINPELFLPSE